MGHLSHRFNCRTIRHARRISGPRWNGSPGHLPSGIRAPPPCGETQCGSVWSCVWVWVQVTNRFHLPLCPHSLHPPIPLTTPGGNTKVLTKFIHLPCARALCGLSLNLTDNNWFGKRFILIIWTWPYQTDECSPHYSLQNVESLLEMLFWHWLQRFTPLIYRITLRSHISNGLLTPWILSQPPSLKYKILLIILQ